MPSRPALLSIVASPERPLSPAQRKFNQLVLKIEKLRADLQAWDEAERAFVQGWGQQIEPLEAGLADSRYALVHKLQAMIGEKGWTRTERSTQCELLCHLAALLINDRHTDAARAVEMKALHDAHAEVDFDTAAAEDMADMKQLFESMSGLDLGDDPAASEDELMKRAFSRMQTDAEQHGAAGGEAAPNDQRSTAGQRRREQEDKDVSQSVREVFRKLASALHPDRAADETDRQRRTEAMQRVNQAYERRDLLSLFALQIEIEQIDASHLASATADKARHYNRVLANQVEELKAERLTREAALRMHYRLDPYESLTPRKLGKLLEQETAGLRSMLAEAQLDLQDLDDRSFAKQWLRARRAELKEMNARDDFPFDLPF